MKVEFGYVTCCQVMIFHYLTPPQILNRPGERLARNETLDRIFDPNGALARAINRIEPGALLVRMVAFNKSENSNWGVPWHQDRIITVADRHDVSGYGNWSNKKGTWHCEPPQHILERMLFVRVHLDDTRATNGAMSIAVGSHTEGMVPAAKAEETALSYPEEICVAGRGDVLILKMLTLHRSKPSRVETNRRVFRIDFASFELPQPLRWD